MKAEAFNSPTFEAYREKQSKINEAIKLLEANNYVVINKNKY